MFPPEWIFPPDPFRLANRRNGSRDEHKHLDRIYEKANMLVLPLGILIYLYIFFLNHFSFRHLFYGERLLDTFNMIDNLIKNFKSEMQQKSKSSISPSEIHGFMIILRP